MLVTLRRIPPPPSLRVTQRPDYRAHASDLRMAADPGADYRTVYVVDVFPEPVVGCCIVTLQLHQQVGPPTQGGARTATWLVAVMWRSGSMLEGDGSSQNYQ